MGALLVTLVLDTSWPVRLGLLAVVLVVGLGVLLWQSRRAQPEIESRRAQPEIESRRAQPDAAKPATTDGGVTREAGPAAYNPNPTDPQGDPTDD
ncbi:hypothetical protein IDVR_28290 [Intrasporangium sp. DVR]